MTLSHGDRVWVVLNAGRRIAGVVGDRSTDGFSVEQEGGAEVLVKYRTVMALLDPGTGAVVGVPAHRHVASWVKAAILTGAVVGGLAILGYGRDGLTMEFGGTSARLQFVARDGDVFDLCLGTAPERACAIWSGRDLDLATPRGRLVLDWIDPFVSEVGETAAASRIVAPMPGTVTRILAEPGVDLPRGAPLLVLEAMKMEHTLRAPVAGHLKALKCAVGDVVQEGTEFADFEPAAG